MLICLKMKMFIYHRATLWQRCSLAAAFWTFALTLLEAKLHTFALLGLWLGGCCLLAAAGSIYQRLKLPSLLYHQKGVNTMQLFRFAFQRTTLDLLAALQVSFTAVHHSGTVKVSENYLPSAEDNDSLFTHIIT